MVFLEFEQPLADLHEQLEKMREIGDKGEVDVSDTIKQLEQKIQDFRKDLYTNLTGWQKVQLSRHPERPYTLYYLKTMCDNFIEMHGDRNVKDDKAIVGGLGTINDKSYMFIGHQKGENTKQRQFRNFGMANPEGYRKALRLMKLAEKFEVPIICLIDTPGAYPGLEAEERGQAEAIARNLFEMAKLKVPIVCIVIGEGASGGALGIGVGDRILMLENTWYSVISPESCSSILWRSWEFKEEAAEALKLTPTHMKEFGLVDDIIPEPLGGAHHDPEWMAQRLKKRIVKEVNQLKRLKTETLLDRRVEKFSKMGQFVEGDNPIEEKSKKSSRRKRAASAKK